MKNIKSKWIVWGCIMGVVGLAIAQEGEKCTKVGVCGDPTEATYPSCKYYVCPDRMLCQNPGTSQNCSQWAEMVDCEEYSKTVGKYSCVGAGIDDNKTAKFSCMKCST
jgi:hypothetical protein